MPIRGNFQAEAVEKFSQVTLTADWTVDYGVLCLLNSTDSDTDTSVPYNRPIAEHPGFTAIENHMETTFWVLKNEIFLLFAELEEEGKLTINFPPADFEQIALPGGIAVYGAQLTNYRFYTMKCLKDQAVMHVVFS